MEEKPEKVDLPDGIVFNYRKDRRICLVRDGEIVAWTDGNGHFHNCAQFLVCREVGQRLETIFKNWLPNIAAEDR